MSFQHARTIADAVLYEGYVLYPYRASAQKNQVRFQFGVLAPRRWSEAGGCESSWSQTECLVEAGVDAAPMVRGKARFLQLQRRTVEQAHGDAFREVPSLEVDGRQWTAWDEGVEREVELRPDLAAETVVRFELPGGREEEPLTSSSGGAAGRLVRQRRPITGEVRVAVERLDARLLKIRARLENVSAVVDPSAPRDEALRSSLLGAHVVLTVDGGEFVSLLDPPVWAQREAAACRNTRTWPVLVGPAPARDTILSSPIILYDYPAIAEESPGDLYDGTEIDEILTLRTLALTEEEKRQARATDARAAAIIDRVDGMTAETMGRLHGAVRSLRETDEGAPAPPWWNPATDASYSPDTETVQVGGVAIARGSVVRLHPGRNADAQDMFLAGRLATVQGIFVDLEERRYVAVALSDDPTAEGRGRYLYFSPDEIEPAEGAP